MSTKVIAVTGASGYIGRHLVAELSRLKRYEVAGLSGNTGSFWTKGSCKAEVKYVAGNLAGRPLLSDFTFAGCTVVNLAYMWTAGLTANLRATDKLLEQCAKNGISRLIHLSTAAVVGRSKNSWVDETTHCNPVTEYGRTKLAIERLVSDFSANGSFDVVVLRPSSVFGPAGAPLQKLCFDLLGQYTMKNYLRLSLFGHRAMNLVPLENVTAAIRFLIEHKGRFSGETLMISDDEDPMNNFIDVERILRGALGLRDCPVPPVPLPRGFLELMLRFRKRNIIDTRCRFRSERLTRLGFSPPLALQDALVNYGKWYLQSYLYGRELNVGQGGGH